MPKLNTEKKSIYKYIQYVDPTNNELEICDGFMAHFMFQRTAIFAFRSVIYSHAPNIVYRIQNSR